MYKIEPLINFIIYFQHKQDLTGGRGSGVTFLRILLLPLRACRQLVPLRDATFLILSECLRRWRHTRV